MRMVECADCGMMFESLAPNTHRVLCPKCRGEHKRQSSERYEKKVHPNRKPKVKRTDPCCVCGGPFSCMYEGKPYCNKHWLRLYNHGTVDPKPRERTNKYYSFGGIVCIKTADGRDIFVDEKDFPKVAKHSWCISKTGYPVSNINGKVTKIHRFILNPDGNKVIDHINGDTLDNCRRNLRICSQAENTRNARVSKNNTSGATGVKALSTGKYLAVIMVDRKTIELGRFNTFEEAKQARLDGELKYFGDFAPCLGVNKSDTWITE